MLITFSVCLKDAHLLIDLLKWIEVLGPCKNHVALITADAATPFDDVLEARTIGWGFLMLFSLKKITSVLVARLKMPY